ncbi:hypothetical protein [Alicyclobacillus ferrooxydans]|uniref:Uncharacterized protein n=1 Tax=Alicyclobacillus ferrooxydans TaxID=471514 RepID=A0A0P9GL88_9BACL|nr:hypothetical protein [Alicyclobacillus ferrooxydans]KPV40899.1 hypothetical protein AN477_21750 [Alicyclobacillus ferrooxydans]
MKDVLTSALSTRTRVFYGLVGSGVFLIAVNQLVQSHDRKFDAAVCASYHSLQYGGMMLGGVALGIAVAHPVSVGLRALIRNLQVARQSDVQATLEKLAWGALIVAMLPALLWVVSPVNLFVDVHPGLMVEADLIVLLMGIVSGTAWMVLLGRRSWLGIIISASMILMLVGSILTRHSWC